MKKVLALTKDGELTYCSAPEELRGKGRCNHIDHQKPGEDVNKFIARIESLITVDESNELVDQKQFILELNKKFTDVKNPNWEKVITDLDNPFVIGKEEDGSYEEAIMVQFDQIETDHGTYHLVAHYEFRGKIYECDYGEVPIVNEDGTITMDGVNWRVLPVVEQHKAGIVSYYDNIVIRQADGRNIAIQMSKDPECDTVKIYGREVPIETLKNYWRTGDTKGLTSGQIYALNNIDPVAFQRFPDLKENIESLKLMKEDDVGDLEWRQCLRYQDIVQEQFRLQHRRMGVTFRTNLSKRQNLGEDNGGLTEEELNKKYPLFYQVNLTDNIKSDLVKRSNVQNADNLNPIAALSQAQKISYTGPGGYHKDKAPYNLRMPHPSHEGLIDPMDISSGKNVGLTGTLSMGYIGEDRMIHKKPENECLAPSDFIPFREHNDPSRGQMAIAHMKQACPITGGEDPIVKTPAWEHIQGAKLGVNLNVAYIPHQDTFEDAVIISESAAEKMTTIQSKRYQTNKPIKLKVGEKVERKQVIGGEEIKVGGTVTKVYDGGFEVETVYKMTPGDKLAGRHGNKSIVARVLPDKDMPKIVDNDGNLVPAQLVMSPLSIAGRKNLGQLMESNQAFGDEPTINKTRTVVLPNGKRIEASGGKQYIMRLNHICEKKLSSYADEMDLNKEASGARLGEMESILLSTDRDRLKILNYLRHQEQYDAHNKLNSLLKAIGVQLTGVNWNQD